jgi:hypothetical protein
VIRFHGRSSDGRAPNRGLLVVGHAILGSRRRSSASDGKMLAASAVSGEGARPDGARRPARKSSAGDVDVLDEATYVEWLADFVECLREDQVLTG